MAHFEECLTSCTRDVLLQKELDVRLDDAIALLRRPGECCIVEVGRFLPLFGVRLVELSSGILSTIDDPLVIALTSLVVAPRRRENRLILDSSCLPKRPQCPDALAVDPDDEEVPGVEFARVRRATTCGDAVPRLVVMSFGVVVCLWSLKTVIPVRRYGVE